MRRIQVIFNVVSVVAVCAATNARAQSRVGSDSATRWTRLGRDAVYGIAEGLIFAGVDQARNDPPSWGSGGSGYAKRAASNVGEFLIQEGVTEGLAALMNRPLDYKRCRCSGTGTRIGHAIQGGLTDQMPDGTHPLAIPRIVGAYAGSVAQASWRPSDGNRARTAIVNGTTSLAIGALINLFYEFR